MCTSIWMDGGRLWAAGHLARAGYVSTLHNDSAVLWSQTAPTCGSADFNHDGAVATDADIEAFFACLSGNCCGVCGSADFNGDGAVGTDADIESFFSVLGGGPC